MSQTPSKIRSSNFKKLVDKFDGTKDPYNHMANIELVIRAKHVSEWCTQFKSFGMTLDGHVLSWFQDIPKNAYTNLEEMEKYFVKIFSLIDIKITCWPWCADSNKQNMK